MLAILFMIVKVIGCILLVLVLIAAVLLLLVLFVPIRYRAGAARYEEITADADVSWLLRFLHVLGSFDSKAPEDKLSLAVKVLGITVYQIPGKPAAAKNSGKVTVEAGKEDAGQPEGENREEPAGEAVGAPEAETGRNPAKETAAPSETAGVSGAGIKEKRKKKKRHKKTAGRRRESGPSFAVRLQDNAKKLQEKAERIRVRKDRVMKILQDDKNQRWLERMLARLKKLLLALIPQIDRLYLHFGFKDPSLTGKLTGALSLLYPACEDRMRLEPEFETEVLEGEAAICGRIRLIRLVLFALPSFVNPQFIKLIKQIKKI